MKLRDALILADRKHPRVGGRLYTRGPGPGNDSMSIDEPALSNSDALLESN